MTDKPRPNANAVRADILGALMINEATADRLARLHRLWAKSGDLETAAHHAEVAIRTRRLRARAERIIDFLDEDDDSYITNHGEAQYAWHNLRRYHGEDLFGDETDLIDVGHPSQCGTLPPGAACWFAHDPHREWWPTGHGEYRLRATMRLVGGGPDGDDPDLAEGMDIQVRDEATGEWFDWHGGTTTPAETGSANDEAAD